MGLFSRKVGEKTFSFGTTKLDYLPGGMFGAGLMKNMADGYKRHGTTTLFAALNVLDGTVIVCGAGGR